jgi:DNA-binding response OmpR family regulator
VLRGVRSRGDDALLVIEVSSDGSELAELRAFDVGCDDYLPRPVAYAVLLARARALLRRSKGRLVPRRRIGALEIDQLERRAMVAERPLQVSRMEFELLTHLAAEPTRVCSKEELLRKVWGFKAIGISRTARRGHGECRWRPRYGGTLTQRGASPARVRSSHLPHGGFPVTDGRKFP